MRHEGMSSQPVSQDPFGEGEASHKGRLRATAPEVSGSRESAVCEEDTCSPSDGKRMGFTISKWIARPRVPDTRVIGYPHVGVKVLFPPWCSQRENDPDDNCCSERDRPQLLLVL